MERTIETGNIVLSNNKVNEYERGDIVIYTDYENKRRISRIIGLPNETVEIKGHNVIINGRLLQEDYINEEYEPIQCGQDMYCGPIKVEENTYYLLGDNRGYSFDSCFQGLISKNKIKAKVSNITKKYLLLTFAFILFFDINP